MKKRVLIAVAALGLASAFSTARACTYHETHVKSAAACPAGHAWDAATQTCVTQGSS